MASRLNAAGITTPLQIIDGDHRSWCGTGILRYLRSDCSTRTPLRFLHQEEKIRLSLARSAEYITLRRCGLGHIGRRINFRKGAQIGKKRTQAGKSSTITGRLVNPTRRTTPRNARTHQRHAEQARRLRGGPGRVARQRSSEGHNVAGSAEGHFRAPEERQGYGGQAPEGLGVVGSTGGPVCCTPSWTAPEGRWCI
jgi:hypothetical protein